jgi:hypothetical protein
LPANIKKDKLEEFSPSPTYTISREIQTIKKEIMVPIRHLLKDLFISLDISITMA